MGDRCRDDAIVCLRRYLPKLEDVKQNEAKPWQYHCLCPAHADHRRSLSISTGQHAHITYHCHTGCADSAIRAALVALGIPDDCLAKPRDTAPGKSLQDDADARLRSALRIIIYGEGTPAERLARVATEIDRMPAGHIEVDAMAARLRLSRPVVYRATSGRRRGGAG